MDVIDFDLESLIRLIISFTIGTVIGFEREYHSKAAGLRTMIMICLGSTVFTEISISIGGSSPDRIASNIITGIGFLGAGVIFKDGLTITGITTATAIWICAALGMAVGAGEYFIAMAGSVIVLFVLIALQNITLRIERFHQARTYRITYTQDDGFIDKLESILKQLKLKFLKKKDIKNVDAFVISYEIYGRENSFNELTNYLKKHPGVKSFEF